MSREEVYGSIVFTCLLAVPNGLLIWWKGYTTFNKCFLSVSILLLASVLLTIKKKDI